MRLAISGTPGSTEIPGCPGVYVDMVNPLIAGPVTADGSGVAVFAAHIPAALEGQARGIQAVQVAICDVSAVLGWVFPQGSVLDLAAADARLLGEAAGDRAGWSISGAGDVNGDGFDDILVWAPLDSAGARTGAVAPFHDHLLQRPARQ